MSTLVAAGTPLLAPAAVSSIYMYHVNPRPMQNFRLTFSHLSSAATFVARMWRLVFGALVASAEAFALKTLVVQNRGRRLCALASDDPFKRTPPIAPTKELDLEAADPDTVVGARILGASLGGIAGNNIYYGLQNVGLLSCSPFNLEGCSARPSPRPSAAAAPLNDEAMNDEAMDAFPFSDVLRNPTSILPKEWKLEGRRYLESAPALAPTSSPPQDVPAAALDELQQLRDQLREELSRLQQTSFVSPPIGVPAASASEPPTTLIDTSSFLHVSDGLFTALVFAALGALILEYVAVNRAPPIPDPLLGGVWGTLHFLAKQASKSTGLVARKAAEAVKGALPF